MPKDPTETRERILACAADLFAKHGYEGVAVSEIAEACDISTSLIYYHFDDKESLLTALSERIQVELVVPAFERLTGEGSPRERIEAFIHAWVTKAIENPEYISIHIRPFILSASGLASDKIAAASQAVEALAAVIAEGVEAGEFDAVDPVLAAECLFGLVNTRVAAGAIGAPHDRLVDADAEEIAGFITALFMKGIRSCS